MYVLLITRLLRGVGRWARKPVNHTSWVALVTPTDRPKSVRNCCLIELYCGVVCVATLSLWHFCWYRGFCHRTGSDLLLFVIQSMTNIPVWNAISQMFRHLISIFHLRLCLHSYSPINTKWQDMLSKYFILVKPVYQGTLTIIIGEVLCSERGYHWIKWSHPSTNVTSNSFWNMSMYIQRYISIRHCTD